MVSKAFLKWKKRLLHDWIDFLIHDYYTSRSCVWIAIKSGAIHIVALVSNVVFSWNVPWQSDLSPFSPGDWRWRQLNKTPEGEGGKEKQQFGASRQAATHGKISRFFSPHILVCACSVSGEAEARRREAAEMQVRVRCGCADSSCPEWAIVELQGVVQPQASFSGDIRGLHIGRLCSAPSPSSSKARYPVPIRRFSLVTCLLAWVEALVPDAIMGMRC
jgi:hypothetical protein